MFSRKLQFFKTVGTARRFSAYADCKVEGYWASSQDPDKDQYGGRYPFPIASPSQWVGKTAFVSKLEALQKMPHVTILSAKGMSVSRITGEWVHSQEYVDYQNKWRWPNGYVEALICDHSPACINSCFLFRYLSHYVMQFNIRPSEAFHRYVLSQSIGLKK